MSLTKYVIIQKGNCMSNVVSENELRMVVREFLSNEELDNDIKQDKLNEFSFGEIASQIPGASGQAFKQYLIERLFDWLIEAGFPISKTSIIGRGIVNSIAAMDWLTFIKYFKSESACTEVAEAILQGVQEAFQEKGYDAIVQVMFGTKDARLEGLLGSPFRELLNKQFLDLTNDIRVPIVDFLCNHRDISQLTGVLKRQLPVGASAGVDEFTPMVIKK
jgi:hypothetical protein